MNRVGIGLLALAAFMAPIYGGQLPIATAPGSPDLFTLREAQHASTAHFLIGLFAALAYLVTLISNRVVQAPTPKVFAPLAIFGGALVLSIGTTDFKFLTLRSLGEWLSYLMAVLAAVAIVGRGRGILAVLGAFVAGCAVVGAAGVFEYAGMRGTDPSWRIFAGWINPNALAGMLGMGFILAACLCVEVRGLLKAGPIAAAVLIGLAVLMTQSKGGILAMAIGLVVTMAALALWTRDVRRALEPGLPLILVFVLGFAVRASAAQPGGVPTSRLEAAGGTAEQSVGYRQLLWKGAVHVSAQHPLGLGMGTYGVESGRSGLHEPTYLAHQSYLQLAMEAGWIAFAAFVWMAGAWLTSIVRGATKLIADRAVMLAGVLGAAVASGAHNAIDSGWYHYGIGFGFFLLVGVGLQLAADGSAPEFFPAKFRSVAGYGATAVVVALLGYSATVELAKGAFVANPSSESAHALVRRAALDDEAWVIASQFLGVETDPLQRACDLAPSTKNLRRLARAVLASEPSRADQLLAAAVKRGPNNLQTLRMMLILQLQQGSTRAEETYQRILSVEKSSLYQIRAVPELVVTDTAEARLDWLDAHPEKEEAGTLQDAVDILLEYAKVTAPMVLHAVKTTGQPYAGESIEDVQSKMDRGKKAADALANIYRRFGETERAVAADEAAGVFAGFGL